MEILEKTLLTPEQMRTMEQMYFAEAGVKSIDVMERAAAALVAVLEERFGSFKTIFFACGPGGNGGDGGQHYIEPRRPGTSGASPSIV